jgi:hypothetical protein
VCFKFLLNTNTKCVQVIPSLACIDEESEHMGRCVVEGLRLVTPVLTYEASLLYISWVLDLQTPTLSTAISVEHHYRFKFLRFFMTWVIWLPGQRTLSVWLLRRSMKQATEASEETLEKLKAKAESYPSSIQ